MQRVRLILGEMYAYYRRNLGWIGNIERDAPFMKMPDFDGRTIQSNRKVLAERLGSTFSVSHRAKRMIQAIIRHALEFSTWRTLTNPYDLSDAEAGQLIVGLVEHVMRLDDAERRPH